MFGTYQEIFNLRGIHYHRAMLEYPLARQQEFQQAIALADLEDSQVVLDIPSGGGYLQSFIQPKIKMISVETSTEFARNVQEQENNTTILCDAVSHIPLLSESGDRIISLAGSHHLPSKIAFYQEAYRLLKSQGIFVLADVREGSGVDGFLNIFVDQYNSMGHKGEFLNAKTSVELEDVGFRVLEATPIAYHWQFKDIDEMIYFCKLLFGIDRANDAQILEGIAHHLGYTVFPTACHMNWELYFFKAIKR